MKENIIDKILSSSGYLPPRNEEEMSAFEKIYSKVEIDESFHVDVESIVNGTCHYKPKVNPISSGKSKMSQYDLRAAARNSEGMPKEVIDKLKKQHQDDGD